jgi:hypothetical protein
MRPRSIVIFDWLFLASLVLSVVNTVVSYSAIVELFATDPTLRASGVPGGAAYVGSHGFSIVVSLILWFFISRRASNVAKWILTALTAIGVLSMVRSWQQPELLGGVLLGAVVLAVLQCVAVYFLFRKDAAAWLEGKVPVDPRAFD